MTMKSPCGLFGLLVCLTLLSGSLSFEIRVAKHVHSSSASRSMTQGDNNNMGEQEYRNVATQFLSNFMSKQEADTTDALADIAFSAPKLNRKLSLELMAAVLDAELYKKEWFVTGKVNPIYFADSFRFQDPDVTLDGIEAYARGVNKLFDQATSRAEIISTVVNEFIPDTITCTWRLSGKANIGPGLNIKPYIVCTDLTIDPETGLVVFQEDRFDLPQWDILLSSLFPFLIGKLTAPPAPPAELRVVTMPTLTGLKNRTPAENPFDVLQQFFGGKTKTP